jgi:hypothetical protein
MNGFLILAVLVLLASAAVIVGTVVFFVWAAQYFGRRAYRRATRRHLFVPVEARVTRVLYHRDCATLHVVYELGGVEIVNRFLTTHDAARLAEQSKQVALLIDPDYPKDIVVAPAFEVQAAAAPRPDGWGMPLGARSFPGYALRLFICLVLGGGLAVGLGWLRRGTVDSSLLVILSVFLPLMFIRCLLLASSRFKSPAGERRDQSAEEGEKGLPGAAETDPGAAGDRGQSAR